MEVPFKVLTAFKGGVVLTSIPEGRILRLREGDVLHVTHTNGALTDVNQINVEAAASRSRLLPHDGAATA